MSHLLTTTPLSRFPKDNANGAPTLLTASPPADARGVQVRASTDTDGRVTNVIPLNGGLRARVLFVLTGADNATFNFVVYGVRNAGPELVIRQCLGKGTATAGTQQPGAAGRIVGASERMADTITYTESSGATTPIGPTDKTNAAFADGPSQAYSPADNSAAELYLTGLGRYDALLIVPDVAGAGTATAYALLAEAFKL